MGIIEIFENVHGVVVTRRFETFIFVFCFFFNRCRNNSFKNIERDSLVSTFYTSNFKGMTEFVVQSK